MTASRAGSNTANWGLFLMAVLLLGCGAEGSQPRGVEPGTSVQPEAAGTGAPARTESAEEIAAWLLDRYGIEKQIPMIRDELVSGITHPRRDRLVEILTEELEKGLRPRMVELCVMSFTPDELRDLRAGSDSPETLEGFARWARACGEDLTVWSERLLESAYQRLESETPK